MHYDDLIRVPLVIHVPGVKARRETGLVELTDIHPSCLGLVGLDVNAGVQGIDWSTAMRDGSEIGRDDIYSDMYDMAPMTHDEPRGPYGAVQTIRTRQWKLNIYPVAGPGFGQLFDLVNDPDERENLYADPAHRETREDLLWRLHQRTFNDTDPLPLRLTQW